MLGRPEPEDYARQLLTQLNVERLDDLDAVLTPLRLTVREVGVSSFEGLLVCRKDRSKGSIAISRSVKERGRKRFTVCHEIAHFLLPGHGETGCTSKEIEGWSPHFSQKEVDANRFASEVLLPTRLIYPLVEKQKATIALAREISLGFDTSLTAAAYKTVHVTNEACALVWSEHGRIKWFTKSDSFFGFVAYGDIDPQSRAAQLMNGRGERELEGETFAQTWLQGDGLTGRNKLWEDSIFLPTYNGVLTILTSGL